MIGNGSAFPPAFDVHPLSQHSFESKFLIAVPIHFFLFL
jgi:hypothetical protein